MEKSLSKKARKVIEENLEEFMPVCRDSGTGRQAPSLIELTKIGARMMLQAALEEGFPSSDIQRCTKHRTENILNKVLKETGIRLRITGGRYSMPLHMSMQKRQ